MTDDKTVEYLIQFAIALFAAAVTVSRKRAAFAVMLALVLALVAFRDSLNKAYPSLLAQASGWLQTAVIVGLAVYIWRRQSEVAPLVAARAEDVQHANHRAHLLFGRNANAVMNNPINEHIRIPFELINSSGFPMTISNLKARVSYQGAELAEPTLVGVGDLGDSRRTIERGGRKAFNATLPVTEAVAIRIKEERRKEESGVRREPFDSLRIHFKGSIGIVVQVSERQQISFDQHFSEKLEMLVQQLSQG